MSKTESGKRLILIGIALNVVGRVIFAGTPADLAGAAIGVVWAVGSVTMVIFGIYRLLVGRREEEHDRRQMLERYQASQAQPTSPDTPPIPPPN